MILKKHYFLPAVFVCVVCLSLFVLSSAKQKAFAQFAANANSSAQITPPAAERPRVIVEKTASVTPAVSETALTDNIRYKDSLDWVFGSRTQRGWYIYLPLIQETIKTSANAETIEFARAVAVWQKNSGSAPTGIIDGDTLFQMIKNWQAQRLNSSQMIAGEELFDAPINDFYDPTRGADLLMVEKQTYAAYKKMVAQAAKDLHLQTTASGDLAEDEKFLKIVSAYRSREHQARLRAASPSSGSAGLAVNSPHFTGHALDLYVGGEPVTTKDFNRNLQIQTPVYKWLVKNAARFGFYPYYYEPWHWEYVPANIQNNRSSLSQNQ